MEELLSTYQLQVGILRILEGVVFIHGVELVISSSYDKLKQSLEDAG